MISKKLLGEVLDTNITKVGNVDANTLYYDYKLKSSSIPHWINIYELAHKCKEWASSHRKQIVTYSGSTCFYIEVRNIDTNMVEFKVHSSETNGVIEACEWILENKEK